MTEALVGIGLIVFAVWIVRRNETLAVGSWLAGWVILALVVLGGLALAARAILMT